MKGFIAIILFFVLALAGVKTGHLSVASSIAVPGQCAVQDDCFTHSHSVNEGAIIPLERERYLADMEFSDAYTLAHRVSTSAERLYRFSSIETTQYIKALLRKLATLMDVLTHCSKRVYDTSRSQSWDDACEHYIFGMRRILI